VRRERAADEDGCCYDAIGWHLIPLSPVHPQIYKMLHISTQHMLPSWEHRASCTRLMVMDTTLVIQQRYCSPCSVIGPPRRLPRSRPFARPSTVRIINSTFRRSFLKPKYLGSFVVECSRNSTYVAFGVIMDLEASSTFQVFSHRVRSTIHNLQTSYHDHQVSTLSRDDEILGGFC
jgi:hypothetical protein